MQSIHAPSLRLLWTWLPFVVSCRCKDAIARISHDAKSTCIIAAASQRLHRYSLLRHVTCFHGPL